MRVAVEDKIWFSPSKIKMAVSGEHCLPLVKIPGSGKNVYSWLANRVCGVSLTSNRLEDRLKSEILGSYREIENVPVSGFEAIGTTSLDLDAPVASRGPFFARHWTSQKVLVRDPRGFIVGISARCWREGFPRIKTGTIPGELVYAWPATRLDVDDGPWILPAGSKIAKRARAFSEAVEKKEAFHGVSEMEVLGVYTGAHGDYNGQKYVFLGSIPYEKAIQQTKRACGPEKDFRKPVPKKALFAQLGECSVSLKVFSEEAASKTFLKAPPEKIPADLVSDTARVAKLAAASMAANPVDLVEAASLDSWEKFRVGDFVDWLGWRYDGRRSRTTNSLKTARAAKLPGKPTVELFWASSPRRIKLAANVVSEPSYFPVSATEEVFSSSLERDPEESGAEQLSSLLEAATEKLGLEQPSLGTRRKASPVQLAWWTVYRLVEKTTGSKPANNWKIAEIAGRSCFRQIYALKL